MTFLIVLLAALFQADTLDLARSYAEAEAHHPLRPTLELQDDIGTLTLANLRTRYLPSLALAGQAVYYSDVATIPIELPGASAPSPPNEQARLGVTVDQLIYDGGLTAGQRALEETGRDLARQQVSVELYGLREQVNAAYFGALLQDARLASLRLLADDLRARREQLAVRVREGVVLPDQLDVLDAERLRVLQQIEEALSGRRASLDVLGTLLGRPLPDDLALRIPDPAPLPEPDTRLRPEYRSFALNRDRLDHQADLAARKTRPRLSGFAEGGLGRPPGLDFFEDQFRPYYSAGIRVRWAFWDWQASRRERAILALRQDVVQAQEAAFTQQLTALLQRQRRDVDRLEQTLARDAEIVSLRARITERASSQLDAGVLTATEYVLERNAEQQARLAADMHRLQLAQARVAYRTTLGIR